MNGVRVERARLAHGDVVVLGGAGSLPVGGKRVPAAIAGGRAAAREESIRVDSFIIEGGRVRYSDAQTGRTEVVDDLNAELGAESLIGPFVAGGAASCAIVFKVFEPKNPMPEGCRILAVHALETRSRGRGAPWDAGAGPTRQGSAKGSPFKRFRKRR